MIYKLNTVPHYDSATVVVHANEGEFGGTWTFDIAEGDSVFDQTLGTPAVSINIMKADGAVYSDDVIDGMDENGRVTVTIVEQMTTCPGEAVAELVFTRTGMKKATANFVIDVERSPLNMGGYESESLINYVERNREAAEYATVLAEQAAESMQTSNQAAQSAAESAQAAQASAEEAQEAAEEAVEDVVSALRNLENMPQTLQELAASLASIGIPQRFLGFNGDGDAAAYDTGFVTPQMYGAKADGTTDDKAAFEAALACGHKVVIPPGSYSLSASLWSDDSIVINNSGTYTNNPLIVSKVVRESAPIERLVKQFNASNGNVRDYNLRGACYDSTNDWIIVAYGTDYESESEDTDLVLTAYDTDFNPVTGMSKVISDAGQGAGICYNPTTHKIYVACTNGGYSDSIGIVDPDTLTVESWQILLPLDNVSRCIMYDDDNDLFYVTQDSANGYKNVVYNPGSAPIDLGFNVIEDQVKEAAGLSSSDTLTIEQGIVYKGQVLQLFSGSGAAYIVQYDYSDFSVKKVYRVASHYLTGDEAKALVNVGGTIYLLTDIANTDGQKCVSVSKLLMDERVDGYQGIYEDAKILGNGTLSSDLDDLLTVGCYTAPRVSAVTGLTNVPTSQPFVMWVLPVPFLKESRAQVMITYHGDVFIRTYVAHVSIWYGWRQLAESPRKGATKSGTWDGAGYITANGTEVRFTIPFPMPTESGSMPTITVTSLRTNVRQGGNYLVTSDSDVATDSDYVIAATPGPFGINVILRKNAAFANVVNNGACGISATISMRFT